MRAYFQTVLAIGLAGLLSGVLAGCDTLPQAKRDPYHDDQYPQVAAIEGMDQYVVYGTPTVVRVEGRPISISVPMRSRSDSDLNVQYRFEFFDQNKQVVRPEMEWRYIQIPPRMQVFLQGDALDTKAVDWRLTVRPTRG